MYLFKKVLHWSKAANYSPCKKKFFAWVFFSWKKVSGKISCNTNCVSFWPLKSMRSQKNPPAVLNENAGSWAWGGVLVERQVARTESHKQAIDAYLAQTNKSVAHLPKLLILAAPGAQNLDWKIINLGQKYHQQKWPSSLWTLYNSKVTYTTIICHGPSKW